MQRKVQEQTPSKPGNSALIIKLQREIKTLKDANQELQEQLQASTEADAEKAKQLQVLSQQHSSQLEKIFTEYKVEAKHDLEVLKKKLEEFDNKSYFKDSRQSPKNQEEDDEVKDKNSRLERQNNINIPPDEDADFISTSDRLVLREIPTDPDQNDGVSFEKHLFLILQYIFCMA